MEFVWIAFIGGAAYFAVRSYDKTINALNARINELSLSLSGTCQAMDSRVAELREQIERLERRAD